MVLTCFVLLGKEKKDNVDIIFQSAVLKDQSRGTSL